MGKYLPWVGIVWGGLIVLRSLPMLLVNPANAYELGNLSGVLLGVAMLGAGLFVVIKKSKEPKELVQQEVKVDPIRRTPIKEAEFEVEHYPTGSKDHDKPEGKA